MPNNTVAGSSITYDETNTSDRYRAIYQLASNTVLNVYNPVND